MPGKKIFNCNFDYNNTVNAQCGGTTSQFVSGMTPSVQIYASEAITINGLSTYITDVTSISK